MSVVATRVFPDRIEIAADSQITWGMTMQNAASVKLFSTDLGLTVGACGSMQEIGLFRIYSKTRIPPAPTEDGIMDFMHAFRLWMIDNAEPSMSDDETAYHIVFGDRAFCVVNYAIREIEDYDAIGTGMDYALTALYLSRDPHDAVEVACKLNIYCSGPIETVVIPKGDW